MLKARTDSSVLLDVTRLVTRSWTARRSTGIDRVSYAYLRHYRSRALAVVQYRGLIRVADAAASEKLFEMLLGPPLEFRRQFVPWLLKELVRKRGAGDHAGKPYINVGDSDFDLASHHAWTAREQLRPFYMLHDLIPMRHPHFTRPHAVERHRGRVLGAIRNGHGIILSSQTVAGHLSAFATDQGLTLPERMLAPLGAQDWSAAADACARSDPPYFVCIGTIEPRKNHALLLKVWSRLTKVLGEQCPRLIIIGQTGKLTGDILNPLKQDRALAANVEVLHDCSDERAAAYLAGARAVLMPSLAEGFGLPVIEALQARVPVIAADVPIMREITQGCATLIAGDDVAGWAKVAQAGDDFFDAAKARTRDFRAPKWGTHFALVDALISADGLKSAAPCESSLAA